MDGRFRDRISALGFTLYGLLDLYKFTIHTNSKVKGENRNLRVDVINTFLNF